MKNDKVIFDAIDAEEPFILCVGDADGECRKFITKKHLPWLAAKIETLLQIYFRVANSDESKTCYAFIREGGFLCCHLCMIGVDVGGKIPICERTGKKIPVKNSQV